ncbi:MULTISPECIES: hypothetical protein [Limnospira]|uniref:hypothetical protein n=1 Tax=Limnospira TaxID=2596745 RepID=UPI0028E17CDC|nr:MULTISPECIES: hypothetical protein [unclassified Limnospira]MDT9192793.1 hypothetical protein [Limnospira sp. PMC 1245.20]MDT9208231.1 hypothetical protein [Limnospira sp. PMC 1252.20]MDT9233774.1 hypothetical protein [Limnospira sp. PMC 917.15]MDY7051147.1 hypothetical protein [Limnospira fusiformis LS22]
MEKSQKSDIYVGTDSHSLSIGQVRRFVKEKWGDFWDFLGSPNWGYWWRVYGKGDRTLSLCQ